MIVGPGMLDGACPGDVFAGPPVEFVYETLKLLYSPKGILHIVNNYTGDRTAWEMAKEMCEADGHEGRRAARQRRRRGQGLDLDRRPARRGRQLLRHQGGRRRVGERRRARRAGPDRREGHRQRAHDGHRAQLVHPAGPRHAAVRDRRRRDGDRHRHPRRAGPRAHQDRLRRTRSSTSCSTRSSPTCRSSRATRSR